MSAIADALRVFTLDPKIRAFLEANDPKALEQAERALAEDAADPLGPPPPELADAWRRYQHGGDVEGWELSKLDEWRAERAQEAGY